MTNETFMTLLLLSSILTSLFTEALKKQIDIHSNIIAGISSVGLAAICSVGYAFYDSPVIDAKYICSSIALCGLSWLCAMLGYDKVMQALKR